MQTILQILIQLKANQTAFIQFFIFVISISFMTIFVFGPFFKAYDQRLKQTKGADQVAGETQGEAKKLEEIYKSRAREINEKISSVFEASKKQAADAASTVVTQAKLSATESTDKARGEIEAQKNNASKEVQKISAEIASEITKKLTGAV